MIVTGVRDGEPLLDFRANWYCATEIDAGVGPAGRRAGGSSWRATPRST